MAIPPLLDRRRLLLALAPTATVLLTGAGACTRGAQKPAPYAPTFFNAAEWAFVNSAVARLIPAEGAGPGGIEAGVPDFIDRQMELPYGHGAYFYLKGPFINDAPATLGYQLRYSPREIYRMGILAANVSAQRTHGGRFADLTTADQDRFLQMVESNAVQFSPVPAPIFFAQLWANTKEGYFADPLYGGNRGMTAWKWIGFPGARADFTDWLDQAGRPYPYGPVAINGARS